MGVFTMPSLGADMEAGTLVEWLVKPGDKVKRGDIIAAVETQKGAIEIEVFEDGTVHDLLAEIGKELPVGAPLAVILAEGEAAPEPAGPAPAAPEAQGPVSQPSSPPKAPEPVAASPAPEVRPAPSPSALPPKAASPAARVRAQELDLDLTRITGSGPGGVIVLSDVERATPQKAEAPRKTGTPIEEMRKAIAAAMTRAKQTIPHFYLSHTVDLQPATDWLAARNAGRPPAERVLLGALTLRAAVHAAAKVGVLNGQYLETGFQPSEAVNIGMAVSLRGGGLVAPAILDAQSLDLDGTMAAMRDLVGRARAGRLRGSEMTQGTITVSSLGETGADSMTGVIFPPQVALVGLGAPQQRPWVVDGTVQPRRVLTITLSADHRVADGRQAARFITEFETRLQTPESL